MSLTVSASFLAIAGLVIVHLFSGKLRFPKDTPRSGCPSIAGGGISVACVFVHLILEPTQSEETVAGVFSDR